MVDNNLAVTAHKSRLGEPIKAVIVLFFTAPLFGEYLLGNLKFSEIALLPFVAPLYGGGAIIIRETARRLGRGYGTMWGLGVAYALWEEGLVDMLFFNPAYFPGQAELTETYWPLIGADVWLVLILLAMHSIWSTLVPIVLTERLFSLDQGPWLGRVGLSVAAAVFVLGSVFIGWEVHKETSFLATPGQWLGTAALTIGVVALSVRRWYIGRLAPASVHPALAAIAALIASSLYMLTEELSGWMRVVGCVVVACGYLAFITLHGTQPTWSQTHVLATIGAAIITYGWLGAVMEPESGPKTTIDHIGTGLIIGVAGWLWVLAWRRRSDVKVRTKDSNEARN
jgi:hypothetical protein